MTKKQRPFFKHIVAEIQYLKPRMQVNSYRWLHGKAENLINELGIETVNSTHHQFYPQGLSLVFILSGSHMALHTWPEAGYIHIDMVSCSHGNYSKNFKGLLDKLFAGAIVKVSELDY